MRAVAIVCVTLLVAQQASVRREAPPVTDDSGTPPAVTNAERQWAGADVLLPLMAAEDAETASFAIRAVGRLEEPAVVPRLLALLASPATASRAADAIAQSLRNVDPQQNAALISQVAVRLRQVADVNVRAATGIVALGRLRYLSPDDVTQAEHVLRNLIDNTKADPALLAVRTAAVRSFESLARLNPKLIALEPETRHALASIVARTYPNDTSVIRLYALMALVGARALQEESLALALQDDDEQVRRVAMAALVGNAVASGADARADDIMHGLDDRSALVRYESLRAYVRRVAAARGCAPVVDAFRDPSPHVALAAIDASGDLCRDDEAVTTGVLAEARTPPVIGSWHREAHAFVALAKRSRDQAAISMQAFASHPVWQVRMYAARAAAAMEEAQVLEKLAYDVNDNVREATLAPLQKLKRAAAEPALVAALERTDYQLLRSAALLLKDLPPSARIARALVAALLRVTREGKETSRDTRMALLDALEVHGKRDEASTIAPLLKDFDPRIAAHVAELVTRWKGETVVADPRPVARLQDVETPSLRRCPTVSLKNGRTFRMTMARESAPIAAGHFLKLAADHYYDGLTFHRVVPNFVIQGGSPGANEYAGQKDYMRDEIAAANGRGTIGLSTRGRNTGDAQFFVNLVDNPRLDEDYTVFATVLAADMAVVDEIQEGDEIARIVVAPCR